MKNSKPVIVKGELLLRIRSDNFIPKDMFELVAYLTYRKYSLDKTFSMTESITEEIINLLNNKNAMKAFISIMERYNDIRNNS